MTSPLIDPFEREITYLRLSITDKCNLNCIYCKPNEKFVKLRHEDILTYEEILKVAKIAVSMGIKKIRLTGGEPLVRKNIVSLVERLIQIPRIEDLSLTTNAVRLKELAHPLFKAGLRRINVSLDTLNAKTFAFITGKDLFDKVWEGIEESQKVGLNPIKLNMVVIRGINDHEVSQMARLTIEKPYHVRFIELMPVGLYNFWKPERFVAIDEIKKTIEEIAPLIPLSNGSLSGPAKRFRFPGAKGEIGFISPLSHHFCGQCNRIRLTASGRLRPCLFSDKEIDLKYALRNGHSEKDIRNIFSVAIMEKPLHPPEASTSSSPKTQMVEIGG